MQDWDFWWMWGLTTSPLRERQEHCPEVKPRESGLPHKLARDLWSYIYPGRASIGLHQRDNDRLLRSLKKLRDLGNTLLVVEHDEDTMYASDYIIDWDRVREATEDK